MTKLFSNLPIRYKLFLMLLLFGLMAVGTSTLLLSWSFERGFLRFVEQSHTQEAQLLADRLARLHQSEGSWSGLLSEDERWLKLHRGLKEAVNQKLSAAELDQHEMLEDDKAFPKGGRFALLNAQRELLIGHEFVAHLPHILLTPIKDNEQILGYVGIKVSPPVKQKTEIRFISGLLESFALIALTLALSCIFLAWSLAHLFSRPLQRFADAARQLSTGRLDTRVPIGSRDEFGQLAGHFNHMAGQLEHVEQRRREWLADVSHELRTPLALFRAELEALQDGIRPLTAAGLTPLLNTSARLESLVDDLHQLALTDALPQHRYRQSVHLEALIAERLAAWQADYARAGLALHGQIPYLNSQVQGDPRLLGQVLDNLMRNTLRYTDTGGRLEVLLLRESGVYQIVFRDTAPGVDKALLERIFERFFRVEASRSRCHGGSGLGLAICRQIIQAHSGEMRAQPSPLGGLEIQIELPQWREH